MRKYLFELRKKADKTQAEVSEYLSDRLGLSVRYSTIERGTAWKDISGEKAEALAEILGTTADNIIMLEKTEGGYEGKHGYVSGVVNSIRTGCNEEYFTPLTEEEKAFAEKYLPYADKAIDCIRRFEYNIYLGSLMSDEDFYDLGMLAFLLTVKKLSVKKREDDFFKSVEDPDRLYRFNISRAIKNAYSSYIHSEKALKRKSNLSCISLDSQVSGKDNDGSEVYNFVPSKDIPVAVQAESSWILDNLYSYLNEAQVNACRLLISGWTVPDVIRKKLASKKDIGIIRFYLEQFKKYGKILWKAEDYKIGVPNMYYDFTASRWKVTVSYKSKPYRLGKYSDINTALDLQSELYYHLEKGDFIHWYEVHMQSGKQNTPPSFTYPLPCDMGEDHSDILWEEPKSRKGVKFKKAAADDPKGISYRKKSGTYKVVICGYNLGCYSTFDEALKIRQLAERQHETGNLKPWYEKFKAQKQKEQITYTRMDKHEENGRVIYRVVRNYKRKVTRLGSYSYEEAVKVKKLADEHIKGGDFDEWAVKFYAEYRQRKHRRF